MQIDFAYPFLTVLLILLIFYKFLILKFDMNGLFSVSLNFCRKLLFNICTANFKWVPNLYTNC